MFEHSNVQTLNSKAKIHLKSAFLLYLVIKFSYLTISGRYKNFFQCINQAN